MSRITLHESSIYENTADQSLPKAHLPRWPPPNPASQTFTSKQAQVTGRKSQGLNHEALLQHSYTHVESQDISPRSHIPRPLGVPQCLPKPESISRKTCSIYLLSSAVRQWNTPRNLTEPSTGRKEPHGYFYNELRSDIRKVKELAISGLWTLGWDRPFRKVIELCQIAEELGNLERVTLVGAKHKLDCTADLAFADESPYLFFEVRERDPEYELLMSYRDFIKPRGVIGKLDTGC